MNRISALLYSLAVTNVCYATEPPCSTTFRNDIYPPVFLDKNTAIGFEIAKTSVDPHVDAYPIRMVVRQCDARRETEIAKLPYLGTPGEVESAFLADADFDGTAEIIVIQRTAIYSDTGINYSSDYFTTLVYTRLGPQSYKLDERISTYFGSGGDVLSQETNDTLTYTHPYKTEAQVKNQLASPRYKNWLTKEPIITRVTKKTYLHDQPNTADRTKSYLIPGDQIRVFDQQAGWLEAVFHNKKKGNIKGWVLCKDTLECVDHKPSTER